MDTHEAVLCHLRLVACTLDVLTSEAALVQAQYGLVVARHSYNITRAALEALLGRQL